MSEADAGQYVRAMFEVAWWPMLGAFSQILEECGGRSAYASVLAANSSSSDSVPAYSGAAEEQAALEREMIRLCLAGCRYGLRLGALCAVRGGSEEAKVCSNNRTCYLSSLHLHLQALSACISSVLLHSV
jgi:hypothetical protein